MKKIILFAITALICITSYSQSATSRSRDTTSRVFGKVLDFNKKSLSGAKITLKGSNYETLSDGEGNYFLLLPVHTGTFVYSCNGYKTREISFTHTPIALDILLEKQ